MLVGIRFEGEERGVRRECRLSDYGERSAVHNAVFNSTQDFNLLFFYKSRRLN